MGRIQKVLENKPAAKDGVKIMPGTGVQSVSVDSKSVVLIFKTADIANKALESMKRGTTDTRGLMEGASVKGTTVVLPKRDTLNYLVNKLL